MLKTEAAKQTVKHTDGPWSIIPQSNGTSLIAREYETGNQMKPKGLRLVAFTMQRGSSLPEDEANARLIAAAPDMLAALKEFLFCVVHENGLEAYWKAHDRARAVIANAEGRALTGARDGE